jgi:hypothetical protein
MEFRQLKIISRPGRGQIEFSLEIFYFQCHICGNVAVTMYRPIYTAAVNGHCMQSRMASSNDFGRFHQVGRFRSAAHLDVRFRGVSQPLKLHASLFPNLTTKCTGGKRVYRHVKIAEACI